MAVLPLGGEGQSIGEKKRLHQEAFSQIVLVYRYTSEAQAACTGMVLVVFVTLLSLSRYTSFGLKLTISASVKLP